MYCFTVFSSYVNFGASTVALKIMPAMNYA
jgi:hypothetical protein